MEHLAAVLTGDLIGSTSAEPDRVERSMVVLEREAGLMDSDSRFTRFRGDGWQILLRRPSKFLWSTVYLGARLKADPQATLASRISIGLGQVERLGSGTLSDASGSAFVNSGRGLDEMVREGQTIKLTGAPADDIQRAALAFVADRMERWSPEQAQAVSLKLRGGNDITQGEMAEQIGITRQAVAARLHSAGFALIEATITAFQRHYLTFED